MNGWCSHAGSLRASLEHRLERVQSELDSAASAAAGSGTEWYRLKPLSGVFRVDFDVIVAEIAAPGITNTSTIANAHGDRDRIVFQISP